MPNLIANDTNSSAHGENNFEPDEINQLLKSTADNDVKKSPKFPVDPSDEKGIYIPIDSEEREMELEEDISIGTKSKKHIIPQVIAAIAVSIASMMVGFSSAYTSPALASMDHPNSTLNVTEEEKSWIGSLMPLSALFGSFLGGYLSEVSGRKTSILLCGPPLIVASAVLGSAINVWMIYTARVIIGGCIGLLSLCMPIYLGETTQAEIRGTLGLLPTSVGNGGILICYLIGSFFDWSILAYVGGLIPLTFTIMMIFIPETPRWLLSKGKHEKAVKSLRWLRGPDMNITEELELIKKNIHESSSSNNSIRNLFKVIYIRPVVISLSLMMFQQLSGINAVIFYSVSIFKHAGTSLDSNLCTVIIGLVNIGSTFIANVLIDKLGRKILLICSTTLMILSLASLSAYFYIKEVIILEENTQNWKNIVEVLSWLPLASLVTYVLAFSLGWGPLPWLFLGEGLPNKIRGPAGSLVTVFNWSSSFIVTKTFPGMVVELGIYGVFFIFSIIMILALIFTCLFFPETKGKTLEEIEITLSKPCCGS